MKKIKKIYLFIILLVIILTGVYFILYNTYQSSILLVEDQFVSRQRAVVKNIVFSFNGDMSRLVRELEFLIQQEEIKNKDVERSHELMAQTFSHVAKVYVNDVGLIDVDGTLLANVEAPQLVGVNFAFRDYFKRAKVLKESIPVYEFIEFKGADVGSKGVVIAMPFFADDGEFDGLVLFTLKVDELIGVFDELEMLDTKLWVADENKNILYHPDFEQGVLTSEIDGLDVFFSDVLENSGLGKSYRGSYVLKGRNLLSVSQFIDIGGRVWVLTLETPSENIGSLVSSFSRRQTVFTVIILLVIIILSVFFIYFAEKKKYKVERASFDQRESDAKRLEKEIVERKNIENRLKEKIEELETFSSVSVGREMRMLDLKKEISELKKKLENK